LQRFGGNKDAVNLVKAEFNQNYIPDARFTHALFLLGLEKSGVHFTLDDLTLEEWNYLGELKIAIDQEQLKDLKK